MTFNQAKKLTYGSQLEHKTMKNKDGSPTRARVVGAIKLWKTRPEAIRIPCKHGLYDCFQLGQGETDKPIDQPLKDWRVAL